MMHILHPLICTVVPQHHKPRKRVVSISQSINQSIHPSLFLHICLSVHPPLFISIHSPSLSKYLLSIHLTPYLSMSLCLFIHSSMRTILSVFPSIALPPQEHIPAMALTHRTLRLSPGSPVSPAAGALARGAGSRTAASLEHDRRCQCCKVPWPPPPRIEGVSKGWNGSWKPILISPSHAKPSIQRPSAESHAWLFPGVPCRPYLLVPE